MQTARRIEGLNGGLLPSCRECDAPATSGDLCPGHRKRLQRGKSFHDPMRRYKHPRDRLREAMFRVIATPDEDETSAKRAWWALWKAAEAYATWKARK